MTIDPRHRVPVADAPAGPRVMAAMEVDTVLALLECPVCLLPPRAPPIYQCRTGDPPRPLSCVECRASIDPITHLRRRPLLALPHLRHFSDTTMQNMC